MKTYLKSVNLEEFEKDLESTGLNNFVEESFKLKKKDFANEEVEKLLKFKVPKLGPNGSCSITDELEENPYDLAETLNITDLANDPNILRIWRLKEIVKQVMDSVSPDWFGIYRKVKNKNGEWVLLKEAYAGRPSRAEFPLTEEFAKGSNNSTVGLSGKAVVFQDLATYAGPYYECDDEVQSEYCGPILSDTGEVIGIVDAESFTKNFFTPEKILQLTKVCHDLGKINFGK